MPRRKRAGAPCEGCTGRQARITTLEMQLTAEEQVIAMQNGALDAIGRIITRMPGGAMAQIAMILERHGVPVARPQRPL